MSDYGVVIERDEDGIYVASVPSLPGCYTQGVSREQAMERVREAIWCNTGARPDGVREVPA